MSPLHGEYLGQTPVDITTHPKYSTYTPVNWAMFFLESYGQIDGGHHKAWVLDQISRAIHGTPVICERAAWADGHTEDRIWLGEPSQAYLDWVVEMTTGENEGYDYDEGIAP